MSSARVLGVGEDEFVIGVAGDMPNILVDDLVVVVTQPDQVASGGEAAFGVEFDVVHLIDAGITAGEPAVEIASHDRGAHMSRDGADFGECGHDLPAAINQERRK